MRAAEVAEGTEYGRGRLLDGNTRDLEGRLWAGLWGCVTATTDGVGVGDNGWS